MRYLSTYAPGGGLLGAAIVQPGELPRFGDGRVLLFFSDASWTVPDDVTRVRVRVIGAGGGVLPGGATSFGALISATGGGAASGDTPGAGGAGFGGDFQASGGAGGAGAGGGGGACGSQLGDGGAGGLPGAGGGGGGGGGACGGHAGGDGVGGATPPDRPGGRPATPLNPGSAWGSKPDPYVTPSLAGPAPLVPFLFHSFPAGFARSPGAGGGGGGTSNVANDAGQAGGLGAGGGGAAVRVGVSGVTGGRGGGVWPWVPDYERSTYNNNAIPTAPTGFIGGGLGGALGRAGAGGGGYAHGEFDVDPGQVFALTVPQPGAGGVTAQVASGGLIIVEF